MAEHHMAAEMQSEMARYQFVWSISPRELCVQTQLLDLDLEREAVGVALKSHHIRDGLFGENCITGVSKS